MNVFSSLQRRARARIIRKRATKRDGERENRQKKHQCSIFPIHNHIMLFSAEQSNWAVQYRCKTYGMEHHQIDWWYQFVTSRKTKANTNIAKHWSSIELRERERTMFDSFFSCFYMQFRLHFGGGGGDWGGFFVPLSLSPYWNVCVRFSWATLQFSTNGKATLKVLPSKKKYKHNTATIHWIIAINLCFRTASFLPLGLLIRAKSVHFGPF